MLPFQLIYKGKTERSLPSYDFPEGFSLSFNEKHCSNEIEIIRLIDDILLPYIGKVKKEHNLPDDQNSFLIWDAFRAQSTATVMEKLSSHGIQTVMVPANRTHSLQPLDLTTNASFKRLEKRSFSEYFSPSIMVELEADPSRDVTTIRVVLRFSALKSIHENLMKEIYEHFKADKGKALSKQGGKQLGLRKLLIQLVYPIGIPLY